MSINVTIALGIGSRYSKLGNIRITEDDAVRNALAWEPPSFDILRSPLSSIDATFVVVEVASVVVGQGSQVGQLRSTP